MTKTRKKTAMRVLLCLLTAVIMLVVSGCCGALTAEEYKTAISDGFSEYTEATKAYINHMSNGDHAEAAKMTDSCIAPLDKLSALNAPDKFKSYQQKIFDGVKSEKEYLGNVKKFLELADRADSLSEGELAEYIALTDKMDAAASEALFVNAIMDAVKALSNE